MAPDRAAFLDAYDELMRRWPAGTQTLDLPGPFGTTRVYACGPVDGPVVVLLPAYQATSAQWTAIVERLHVRWRVYAVDPLGDAGRSVADRRPVKTPDDLTAWIDGVLDGLGLASAQLAGHSYGAWMALTYALQRPARVERVILLDPTMCFGTLLKGYLLHALPALYRPTGQRRLALIRWESRQADIDPGWLEVTAAGADAFADAPTVPTKIPEPAVVSRLEVPAMVILAGRSRVHTARVIAKRAAGRLPTARVEVIDGASHYGLPMTHAEQVANLIM